MKTPLHFAILSFALFSLSPSFGAVTYVSSHAYCGVGDLNTHTTFDVGADDFLHFDHTQLSGSLTGSIHLTVDMDGAHIASTSHGEAFEIDDLHPATFVSIVDIYFQVDVPTDFHIVVDQWASGYGQPTVGFIHPFDFNYTYSVPTPGPGNSLENHQGFYGTLQPGSTYQISATSLQNPYNYTQAVSDNNFTISFVPEPSTAAFGVIGSLALLYRRNRNAKA